MGEYVKYFTFSLSPSNAFICQKHKTYLIKDINLQLFVSNKKKHTVYNDLVLTIYEYV